MFAIIQTRLKVRAWVSTSAMTSNFQGYTGSEKLEFQLGLR